MQGKSEGTLDDVVQLSAFELRKHCADCGVPRFGKAKIGPLPRLE